MSDARRKLAVIAEDDAINQRLAKMVLEKAGFQTEVCNDGGECIDLLAGDFDPDLLILDLQMPRYDGFHVLKRLNDLNLIEQFPICVLTGDSRPETVKRALQAGAHDYVVKPYKAPDLDKRVRELVFDASEAEIRKLIENLRVHDPSMFHAHGLQSWAQRGFNAYQTAYENNSICVLIPQSSAPAAYTKMPYAEITAKTHIFRKCSFGWRKVWPTYAVSGKKAMKAS